MTASGQSRSEMPKYILDVELSGSVDLYFPLSPLSLSILTGMVVLV